MRFHQAVTFLPADEILRLSAACDDMGYSGVYLSDHLFNPRDLASRYTYSKAPDGAPFWEKETAWPDPMCVISALSGVTTNLTFTTGIYIAPVRDLITVAKSVGTTAVLSHNRVRLGVGVGWCEEEFEQTGQDFHTRGKRLNDMIPALRALWKGGWVEYHGTHYDVPPCQMNPAPTQPVPILGGGDSEPALRRAGSRTPSSGRAGRTIPSQSTSPSGPCPTSISTTDSRTPGSPTSCAHPGWRSRPRRATRPSRSTRRGWRRARGSPSASSRRSADKPVVEPVVGPGNGRR